MRKRHASQYANFGSLLAMFESYPMTLTIDPAYTQAYTQSDLYPRLELNVIKEDYVPYADGKFSDYFMSPDENPIITDQEMEYSAILDMYRLKACKLPILGYPLLDGRQSAPV